MNTPKHVRNISSVTNNTKIYSIMGLTLTARSESDT